MQNLGSLVFSAEVEISDFVGNSVVSQDVFWKLTPSQWVRREAEALRTVNKVGLEKSKPTLCLPITHGLMDSVFPS